MATIPDGWTEVTNGEWGHGPVRFPDNVPVGVHYQNSVGGRAVLTPDDVFMVEGISLDPPNRGKPDGAWWAYVAGETDTPTNFEPWIDPSPAPTPIPEPATTAPVVPETPAPEAPTPDTPAPVAPHVLIVPNAGGGWLIHAEHAVGGVFHEVIRDLGQAMQAVNHWLQKH